MNNHAETVQAVGMVWVERQDLPIEQFGVAQATGLMMLAGGCEQAQGRCRCRASGRSLLRAHVFSVHLSAAFVEVLRMGDK